MKLLLLFRNLVKFNFSIYTYIHEYRNNKCQQRAALRCVACVGLATRVNVDINICLNVISVVNSLQRDSETTKVRVRM